MVKKRNSKVVSKTNKQQTSLAEKTEQILLTMPRIIATQIGKDLVVQKQQVVKLNLELKKVELQKKKLTQKLTELKKKNTTAAKKQASTTQKALQKLTQLSTALSRSLDAVKKQFQTLSQKKAKYTALQAQLITFQRDWVKKMSNKTTSKPKAKVKAKPATLKLTNKQNSFNTGTRYPQESQVIEIIEVPVQDKVEFAEETMEKVS